MFCYQCQETAKGAGCTIRGVCGKLPETAGLQDLLIYTCKGISEIITRLKIDVNEKDDLNFEVVNSLFMTITNANFDDDAFVTQITKLLSLRDSLADIDARN